MKTKLIPIFLSVILLSIHIISAQQCINIKPFGGPGTQTLLGTKADNQGGVLIYGYYGRLASGRIPGEGTNTQSKYPGFLVDGKFFEADSVTYPDIDDEHVTPFLMKMNQNDSLQWFFHQTGAETAGTYLEIEKVTVDDEGKIYVLAYRNSKSGEELQFAGHTFKIKMGCPYILFKLTESGQFIWSRNLTASYSSFSHYRPSMGINTAGNVSLVVRLNDGEGFRLSSWDDDKPSIASVSGYDKSFRLMTFNKADGVLIGSGSLMGRLNILPDGEQPFGVYILPTNENRLFIKAQVPYGGTIEKIYIEGVDSLFVSEASNVNTKSIYKNKVDNTYIRCYNSSKGSGLHKLSATFTDTLKSGNFTGNVFQSGFVPVIDADGNVVIESRTISNTENSVNSTYNGESLVIDGKYSNSSERLLYFDKDLNFLGQNYLYNRSSYSSPNSLYYSKNTNTIKYVRTIGGSGFKMNNQQAAYAADLNSDLSIFTFDNTQVFPQLSGSFYNDAISFYENTYFSVVKGDTKIFSALFEHQEALNVSWILDGVEVSTESEFTFYAKSIGEHKLVLKAVNPAFPHRVFTRKCNLNVSNGSTQVVFSNTHPWWGANIGHMAVDTVNNYLWGITKYRDKVYHASLDNMDSVTVMLEPLGIRFSQKTVVGMLTDAQGDLWVATQQGDIITYKNRAWKQFNTSELGIQGDPTSLYAYNTQLFLGTDSGLWENKNNVWMAIDGIQLTSPYVPTSGSSYWSKPNSEVSAMAALDDGTLWLGLQYGLIEKNSKSLIFPKHHRMPFSTVRGMVGDHTTI